MSDRGEQKWVFLVALAALILAPICLALRGVPTSTISAVVVACAAAVLFVRLPDVTSFALGPLRAELEKKVAEANATIAQLHDLAVILSRISLGTLQGMGRFGGDRGHILMAKDRTLAGLRRLGCSPEQLEEATADFDGWTEFDLASAVLRDARVQAGGDSNARATVDACYERLRLEPGRRSAGAAQWRECLERAGPIGDDLAQALEDLEHFQKTNELRRPEKL